MRRGSLTDMGGEERRVGIAHHRKTRSRCSIDWTLPPTDFSSLGEVKSTSTATDRALNPTFKRRSPSKSSTRDDVSSKTSVQEHYIELPGFVDRLSIFGERESRDGGFLIHTRL